MRRKKLTALLAFGLLAAMMVVVTGGSASAATYNGGANAGSICGFLPGGADLNNNAGANAGTVTLSTDKDFYAPGETIAVSFDLGNLVNGPAPTSGNEVWDLSYTSSGAVVGAGGGVVSEALGNGVGSGAGASWDPIPWTFNLTASATPGAVTITTGGFETFVAALSNTLDCEVVEDVTATPMVIDVPSVTVNVVNFGGSVDLTSPAPATARVGDTIAIDGSGWDDGGTHTAEVCDVTLTFCGAPAAQTISVTGGVLTGSVTLGPVFASGDAVINVTETLSSAPGATATSTFLLLADRSISAAPAAGGPGTTVAINGSGFEPGEAVAASGLLSGFPPTFVVAGTTGTADGSGNISLSLTVPSDMDTIAVGYEAAPPVLPTSPSVTTGFSFSANSITAPGSLEQNIVLEVEPGDLTMTQADSTIVMTDSANPGTNIQLDGTDQSAVGDLNQISVVDARGTSAGWTLVGSSDDLNNGGANPGSTLLASTLEWVPACSAVAGGSAAVTSGPTAFLDSSTTLCSVAVGAGGGSWDADASLSIPVPANTEIGTFTAILTLTLS
ncbi:MAG: hypothetical protein ACR2N2_01690 [Acidimicrobiia bacterium]